MDLLTSPRYRVKCGALHEDHICKETKKHLRNLRGSNENRYLESGEKLAQSRWLLRLLGQNEFVSSWVKGFNYDLQLLPLREAITVKKKGKKLHVKWMNESKEVLSLKSWDFSERCGWFFIQTSTKFVHRCVSWTKVNEDNQR